MPTRTPDLSAASEFVWRSARLIDRLRFARAFADGSRDAVAAALRAYRNADGGFGHALEPDIRAPSSEPAAVRTALEILDEVDAFADPMVAGACDFLATVTTSDGGLPFILPSASAYPRAPWCEVTDDPPASMIFTAPIAGLLHKHRVAHPWLARATDYCWREVSVFDAPAPVGSGWDLARIGRSYEARAALVFLEHAPDRPRAEEALRRIGRVVLDRLVELDPGAPGEVHGPLDYAPSPASPMRPLFRDEVVAAHLDALAAAQRDDGGWMFTWQAWNPATTLEWRGRLTVDALLVLRAYGRLP